MLSNTKLFDLFQSFRKHTMKNMIYHRNEEYFRYITNYDDKNDIFVSPIGYILIPSERKFDNHFTEQYRKYYKNTRFGTNMLVKSDEELSLVYYIRGKNKQHKFFTNGNFRNVNLVVSKFEDNHTEDYLKAVITKDTEVLLDELVNGNLTDIYSNPAHYFVGKRNIQKPIADKIMRLSNGILNYYESQIGEREYYRQVIDDITILLMPVM